MFWPLDFFCCEQRTILCSKCKYLLSLVYLVQFELLWAAPVVVIYWLFCLFVCFFCIIIIREKLGIKQPVSLLRCRLHTSGGEWYKIILYYIQSDAFCDCQGFWNWMDSKQNMKPNCKKDEKTQKRKTNESKPSLLRIFFMKYFLPCLIKQV